jgi:uncharacterized protein YxeA
MVALIVLNIILIIVVIFFALYIINNKKDGGKNVHVDCVVNDINVIDENENKKNIHTQKRGHNTERVFVGKIITDEEYQQLSQSTKSEISILKEEIIKEFEYFKELRK